MAAVPTLRATRPDVPTVLAYGHYDGYRLESLRLGELATRELYKALAAL